MHCGSPCDKNIGKSVMQGPHGGPYDGVKFGSGVPAGLALLAFTLNPRTMSWATFNLCPRRDEKTPKVLRPDSNPMHLKSIERGWLPSYHAGLVGRLRSRAGPMRKLE